MSSNFKIRSLSAQGISIFGFEIPAGYYRLFHLTLFPLFLLFFTPNIAIIFWYTNVYLQGSLTNFWYLLEYQGIFLTLYTLWSPIFLGSKIAWMTIGCFAIFQLVLMRCVPGPTFKGPETAQGHIPIYKANGLSCYLLTLITFYLCSFRWKIFPPHILYDHFGEIIGALNCLSLALCLFLYFKGRYFPSTPDADSTGNFIFDYYWGTELYPRILGWDIKQFTNCRFGMMSWALIIISFAAKQNAQYGLSDSMLVAVALQLIYITKFFIWETGYLGSLDIMHDRAGYYICWGCLVWVPSIYTSSTLYLVNHPNHLGWMLSLIIFLLGAVSILVNYWADKQRQKVRATQGLCKVWGRPAEVTKARYTTKEGRVRENVLLTSGWWGISRHFHYIPEILGAFFWSLPALFTHFLPYFYVIFLTALLMDRAFRDEKRCATKYGKDWVTYCQKVPYKVIPFII